MTNENKNIGIIKWLIGLNPAKQVTAILMIIVLTLFTPIATSYYSNKKAAERCGTEKIELVQKYTNQIEAIKDKQIEKLELEKARTQAIDSALKVTDRIIQQKIRDIK